MENLPRETCTEPQLATQLPCRLHRGRCTGTTGRPQPEQGPGGCRACRAQGNPGLTECDSSAEGHSPLLAGDDPDLLALAVGCDQPGLPPLVIRGVDDVQDVPVGEAEPLAGQAAVPGPVIVKQGSEEGQRAARPSVSMARQRGQQQCHPPGALPPSHLIKFNPSPAKVSSAGSHLHTPGLAGSAQALRSARQEQQ